MTKDSNTEKKTIGERFKAFQEKHNKQTELHPKINLAIMLIFPLFIMSMAEINQFKGIVPFMKFFISRPSVMLFDLFLTSIVFVFLLSIFRSGWISIAVQSFVYMALSITELFKYGTNGNHLILSDMKLFRSVKSLKSFAYIKITPRLVIYCIIVIAFIALAFYFNPKFKLKLVKRIVAPCACVIPCACLILLPAFYSPVYKVFGVDTTPATNTFKLNEKFQNNGFLAFIIQTASESYANRLTEPENYDDQHVTEIVDDELEKSNDFNGGQKPNVIVVMSESYADFRVFDELEVDDKYYEGFDNAREEGHAGTTITPTYASWTVRSEFELLFGLPVRGINTPNMPQRELAAREQPALAQYYKNWGYHTAYVHPFQSSFYSRSKIYGRFGFDTMIFHNDQTGESDFTVPVEHFGTYVDDKTVYNQLLDLVKTTDDPIYIHTTTMQNHQPYDQGDGDEITNYLTWVQHTNEGLTAFLDELETIDEPTLVFFVGDHFPSLRGETSVYNQLGLNGSNCSELYEQHYFLWSNYDADFSSVPEENVSFFYMPYVIMNIIDAPHDAFIDTMMEYMEKIPVYSEEYASEVPRDEELDMLTYDRVVGDVYSPCPIPEELLVPAEED
ncbi:MAG: sulfatase-like hydrolase/transferase [Ruminococcus flavefaciens]|nr:sulfatase-like hydrolase/transferase [Ruminococcus flavefaciens]